MVIYSSRGCLRQLYDQYHYLSKWQDGYVYDLLLQWKLFYQLLLISLRYAAAGGR